jgi:hypothetical protein
MIVLVMSIILIHLLITISLSILFKKMVRKKDQRAHSTDTDQASKSFNHPFFT